MLDYLSKLFYYFLFSENSLKIADCNWIFNESTLTISNFSLFLVSFHTYSMPFCVLCTWMECFKQCTKIMWALIVKRIHTFYQLYRTIQEISPHHFIGPCYFENRLVKLYGLFNFQCASEVQLVCQIECLKSSFKQIEEQFVIL